MKRLVCSLLASAYLAGTALAVTPEPVIEDYTTYPIFQVNAVTPNILIILDNSGSMNMNAYGTYPGDYGTVSEGFNGAPPYCSERTLQVQQAADNIEAYATTANTYTNIYDDELDLGTFNNSGAAAESLVGLRFANVEVPQGRTIKRAYIQLSAHSGQAPYTVATTLSIYGEDVDDAAVFVNNDKAGLLGRSPTAASVSWNITSTWAANQTDNDTRTPDLTAIVQEIVDREGWRSGNAMAFALGTGSGFREVWSYAGSASLRPQLFIEFEPEEGDCTRYYGYFDPDARYAWDGSKFVRAAGGAWDGNWLNWCAMRRIDVLRKVLMGGLATARTGGGNQVNYGEDPDQTNRVFLRRFDGTGFTPYSGDYVYGLSGGYLYVDTDADGDPFDVGGFTRYELRVQRDATAEPQDFVDGNLAGVLQKVGDKARWGNEWFYYGSGTNREGGFIEHAIGTNMTSLITDLQNTGCDTYTPLAEAYYVAMQYFKQQACDTSLGFKAGASGPLNATNDAYYNGTEYVHCAKSFVILLTDGAPTEDLNVPGSLKNYDGDTNEVDRSYAGNGSDYLDDIALYCRTNDLRADLDGDQNMILYTIYAFGNEANARNLLQDAARNGGFIDKNGNNRPDLTEEWDDDGDGVPDTYFEANDGYQLEKELLAAINDILRRAASGTAVSVLATKGEGEGTLVQAFFKPAVSTGLTDVKWVGYLQSLWVDQYGNTREDTNQNQALDIGTDKIVRFFLDPASGETRAKMYDVTGDVPYPDVDTAAPSALLPLEEILSLWEAGSQLAVTAPALRNIYTYTGSTSGATDPDAVVSFDTLNAGDLGRFFGVEDNATWGALGAGYDDRVNNIIQFVRGARENSSDYTGGAVIRPRTIDGQVWKLGDIVYSTPMSIAKPVENYGLLYDDDSYRTFFQRYKNRETVVYVGANDGMLHAFTGGVYDASQQQFLSIYDSQAGYNLSDLPDSLGIGDVPLGTELWAYIPQNLLPHLKWLPGESYTHVPYVDLQPKVVDARVFPADAAHPGGWGTILIGGLNMGGKQIATDNGTFSPCYFAIDVTNPRNPQLLWERNFANLGLTTNMPSVISVGNDWDGSSWSTGQWYALLPSGPTAYDGSSTQEGRVYVVDLLTGGTVASREFVMTGSDGFMNAPVGLDKGMNYNVDGIYCSVNYNAGDSRIYKITIPQQDSTGATATEYDGLVTDYETDVSTWTLGKLFYCPQPITAPLTLSVDRWDNVWVYGGTGRYLSEADKSSTAQNLFFGIKDPFFNSGRDDQSCFHAYGTECEINADDKIATHLFAASDYDGAIQDGGAVSGVSGVTNYGQMLDAARDGSLDGWYRELCSGSISATGTCQGSGPSERVVNKPAILGGILLVPTFAPNSDVCGFGGNSRLFAVYYESGTAYQKSVVGVDSGVVLDVVSLGEGLSSSFGVHVGKEEGGTVYGQMSTGVIQQINVIPAINPKSGPVYWRGQP